jgi:hypothetical protein
MRYTYELVNRDNQQILDTAVRFESIRKFKDTDYMLIRITDNMTKAICAYLYSQDEIDEWQNKLERDAAWKPMRFEGTKTYNVLEETDGFHVKADLPDSNAKTAAAVGKPTFSAIPPVSLMALGAAMNDGRKKYGRFNWRDANVTSTVFYDAIMRHMHAWMSGERCADDSGIHHLAHAMAGCAILLDAEHNGVLNDDRKPGVPVVNETMKFIQN